MNTYMAGSLITSTATFTNAATGLSTDPTTITLKYDVQGSATTTVVYPSAPITRVSAGVYQAELDTTATPGLWTVEWIGTGTVQAIGSDQWQATPAAL